MPVKGIILIICVGIAIAFYYKDDIYNWLSTLDDDSEEDIKERKDDVEK